jgi:outer membrane protein assembly factor BamA
MRKRAVAAALAGTVLALRCALTLAQSPPADFTVGDIRVEGLQRVSEGTV